MYLEHCSGDPKTSIVLLGSSSEGSDNDSNSRHMPVNEPTYNGNTGQMHPGKSATRTEYFKPSEHLIGNILPESSTIPSVQKAVITRVVSKDSNLRYEDIPVRQPGAGEVMVKIAWTGICGSVRLGCMIKSKDDLHV
jgi:hypothetical protein